MNDFSRHAFFEKNNEIKKGPRTAGLLGDGEKKMGRGIFKPVAIAFSRNVIFLGPWSVQSLTRKVDFFSKEGRSLFSEF